MRTRRLAAAILLALVLGVSGCSGSKDLPSAPPTSQTAGKAKPHVESVEMNMPQEKVRELYGEPTRVENAGKSWVYEDVGVRIGFSQGKVFQVLQTKGSISNGIAIGDPEEKVKATGAELFDEGSTHRWTLRVGKDELWMVTEKGVVIRFYRREYAEP